MSAPILVFGARGQIGRELVALAAARRVPVSGLASGEVNITDEHAVRAAIDTQRPAAVVNAAGYTSVDRAEREVETVTAANVTGPAIVAAACADAGVPFLHLSSEHVFDGAKKTAYVENDRVAPLSAFGRSKADGEAKVREASKRHIILRTSWVYGVHGRNFVKTVLRLAGERDELRMVADQFGCPTASIDIAEAILLVVRRLADKPNTSGTFHFAGTGVTTWHGFAEEVVRRQALFTGRTPKVTAIKLSEYPVAAKRPPNAELDSSKFHATFGYRARPWPERVAETVAALLVKAKAPSEPRPSEGAKAPEGKAPEAKAPEAKAQEPADKPANG